MSYNSQLWFQEGSSQVKLGQDVGYGLGWKLLAGALTPIRSGYELVYFLFTDSSGAEYRLDVNESGVWRSREGAYIYFDTSTARLNFPDGSHWVMAAVSGSAEADAGTRYPTLMRDSNGNEVRIRYGMGAGASWDDSSARIVSIEDVRAPISARSRSTTTSTWPRSTPSLISPGRR